MLWGAVWENFDGQVLVVGLASMDRGRWLKRENFLDPMDSSLKSGQRVRERVVSCRYRG